MTLELTLDDREWLLLPSAFPAGDVPDAAHWEDRVVAGFRDTWGDRLDADLEPMVRAALQHGLSRVRDEDSLTLQFWPQFSVANAIVHLTLVRDDAETTLESLVSSVRGHGPSVVEAVHAGSLGPGVEVRFVIPVDLGDGAIDERDPLPALAGLRRVFVSGAMAVVVDVEPTLPQMIAVLYDSLDELLDSAVVVDEGEEWVPSDDGIAEVLPDEEGWTDARSEHRPEGRATAGGSAAVGA